MKEYIKYIKKIVISAIFLIFLLSNVEKIDAYQIRNIVVPKENLKESVAFVPDYPILIYKKQTAAYKTEIDNYDNLKKQGSLRNRWMYVKEKNADFTLKIEENTNSHTTANSFKRIYEFVHKSQNSIYSKTPNGGPKRHYNVGNLWPGDNVIAVNMVSDYIYDVTGETDQYIGFYDKKEPSKKQRSELINFAQIKDEIVVFNNNRWRWAVDKGVYISDNYIDSDTVQKIWEKFRVDNSTKEFEVYNSSVTRTDVSNNPDNIYYKNMDTAYKFWETTVRGKRGWAWYESPTTTGSSQVNSILNYYDNTFVIPKGNSKKIYIRHIDITGLNVDNIKTEDITNDRIIKDITHGQAIEVKQEKNGGKYIITNPSKTSNKKYFSEEGNLFNEFYEMNPTDRNWIFGNIKYENKTGYLYNDKVYTVQYLSSKSDKEKEFIDTYNCVGGVAGSADSLRDAIINREERREDKNNFNGGNYNYYEVNGKGGNDYYVIDFYYTQAPKIIEKEVYVRHIDVSSEENINTTTVKSAISSGDVLYGKGFAYGKNESGVYNIKVDKQSPNKNGYDEWFKTTLELKVLKDDHVDYECVGSNMTASDKDIADATNKMYNDRLDKGLYDTTYTDDRLTSDIKDNKNNIILVDFYYRSIDKGTIIDRPAKGRIGFYTLRNVENSKLISGDHSTGEDINYSTSSDTEKVTDVVPSGETLRLSVDNAYVYMLGAINIKEQNIEDTYKFDYTLTQKYTVNYLYWTSTCSNSDECGNENVPGRIIGKCDGKVKVPCIHDDCDNSGGVIICSGKEHDYDEKPCPGEYSIDDPTSTFTEGTISRTYNYQLPYKYTFYKVKNMRLYTIDKVDLYDGSNNSGLPLFDGETHTILPVSNYTDSFSSSNTTFDRSTNEHFASISNNSAGANETHNLSSVSKTLSGNLVFYYNNTTENITEDTAKTTAITSINSMFDKLNNSSAAKIESFDVEASSSAENPVTGISETTNYKLTDEKIKSSEEKNHLHVTFYVQNDMISFKNLVKDSDERFIVGKGTNYENTAPYSDKDKWVNKSTEASAIKTIDMSAYTAGKLVEISTKYPSSLRGTNKDVATNSEYLPTDYLTDDDYFEEKDINGKNLYIPETRLNGIRESYGKIYYSILKNGNNNLNFDAKSKESENPCTNSNKTNCHDWNSERNTVVGNGTTIFSDTEMHNYTSNTEKITTRILPNSLKQLEFKYKTGTNNQADIVDIFTPISFETEVETGDTDDEQVDHTIKNDNTESKQIQKNARFTISMNSTSENEQYGSLDTDKYLMQYYIKFDFDVQDIEIHDAYSEKLGDEYRRGDVGVASAGTWIGPIYNTYLDKNIEGPAKISAFALEDPLEAESIVNQESNSYTVRAVAYNTPSDLIYDLINNRLDRDFVNTTYNKFSGIDSTNQDHQAYYSQKNIYGHSNYVAENSVTTENLNRVYDFKITDVKDVDWKNIFRKSTTTTTNEHTSEAYYSGIKKWNVYTAASNEILVRDASQIGSTKEQILPIGPYKNTNSTYVKAPKLGYKFSFDLKTTGKLDEENVKSVVITPSFYYISKDAKTRIDNIKLFYKNSNSKYVSIDNYNLYFVPNDGYRLTFKGTDESYRFSESSLAKSTVKLGTAGKGLKLTNKMMEQSDNMFVQIWYGEYKLPNSTIALEVKDGKYDINKPLKNGYIGVKFDIKVYECTGGIAQDKCNDTKAKRILDYNQPDKNIGEGTNTTQWDYEGYLGYDVDKNTTKGIRIPLENGIWNLSDSDYKFVRSTVILYDTDAKASSDYE